MTRRTPVRGRRKRATINNPGSRGTDGQVDLLGDRSLDGYVEDAAGTFDWSAPDDEVLAFVNDLERPIGTYLYGRRMYETMAYWETASIDAGAPGRSETSRGSGERPRRSSTRAPFPRRRRPHAARAQLRSGRRAAAQAGVNERPFDRRRRPGRPGDGSRARRRMPGLPRPDRRRRRQAGLPARCPSQTRTARRAPLQRRHGAPELRGASGREINDLTHTLRRCRHVHYDRPTDRLSGTPEFGRLVVGP